ncbi:MAG: RseA family anti-sigma factor [Alcaligenaceae bacterium]
MKKQSIPTQASTGLVQDAAATEHATLASVEVSVTISAWMDGDAQTSLPSELFTTSGHATWQVYHLIGDTLRTPELALSTKVDLSQRVAQALVAEPALSLPAHEAALVAEQGAVARETMQTDMAQTNILSTAAESLRLASAPRKLTPMSKLLRRVVWPSVAMAAAVASVVWVARPLFVPELSAPSAQTAKVNAPSSVVTNLEASAVRDYVTAHRQISGPSNVRPASFGAPR